MNRAAFYSIIVVLIVSIVTISVYISNPVASIDYKSNSSLPGDMGYKTQKKIDEAMYYLYAGHSGKIAYHLKMSNKYLDLYRQLSELDSDDEALLALETADEHYSMALVHGFEMPDTDQSEHVLGAIHTVSEKQSKELELFAENISDYENTDIQKISVLKALKLRDITQ